MTVDHEVAAVLDQVLPAEMDAAATFLSDRPGRWFFTGQGRSGLVGQMAAMRLMHLGRPVHVVGEATAPAVRPGDHIVAISKSGDTPVTVHLTGLALENGADLLVVTTSPDSQLGKLATIRLNVPATASEQFGGSLFEQTALILLDALVLQLTSGDVGAHDTMLKRHANLQ